MPLMQFLSPSGVRIFNVPDPPPPFWEVPIPQPMNVRWTPEAEPTLVNYPVRLYRRIDGNSYEEVEG